MHLHRPRSGSKQQSRSVMTDCGCQRAARTHTNPRTAAQSVITQQGVCTNRQTSQHFIRTRRASFVTPPLLVAVSHISMPHRGSKQQVCCYTSVSANPLTPAIKTHPKVKQSFATRRRKANQTDFSAFRAGISHDNSLSQTSPCKCTSRLSGPVIMHEHKW